MNILTIIGARPQFVKASIVSKIFATDDAIQEVLVHTGQHYDSNLSDVFFRQLYIPQPSYQLNINGGSHGEMTGRMLIEIEKVLLRENPDLVLVYGDTNSTLAGALAAKKLHIPIAHVEAGLRSFNMKMPEEINRILTDQISDLLFCPTEIAVSNLEKEGFSNKSIAVELVGDVMYDSAITFSPFARKPHNLAIFDNFILSTIHRAENTDNIENLLTIVDNLNETHNNTAPVVLALHPRTRKVISDFGLELKVTIIKPVGYLEMIWLLQHCTLVVTDSGGLQKESFFFKKPCVTVRDQTEWTELIDLGVNQLSDPEELSSNIKATLEKSVDPQAWHSKAYGDGTAGKKICAKIRDYLNLHNRQSIHL